MNDNQVQEIKRHFDVVAEGLRHEISIVAEGHEVIRREAGEFRGEVKEEFKEVKSLIKFSYAELDQRIRNLEHEVTDSKSRLDRLEQQIGAA